MEKEQNILVIAGKNYKKCIDYPLLWRSTSEDELLMEEVY